MDELLDCAFILKNNITHNFNIKALARNKALEKNVFKYEYKYQLHCDTSIIGNFTNNKGRP